MESMATVLSRAVAAVTKKWAKQRKAEERRASSASRRREVLLRSRRITIKKAAWDIMKAAYLKASSDGQYPAHARQIMYKARGEIQERTGRNLKDDYFTQTLVPDYMAEHSDETADWDVVFDARGHFTEPHTEKVIALGTLDVREYLTDVEEHGAGQPEVCVSLSKDRFPTCGPEHRFGAVLFIEKEGFMPLFRAVHLAERYDVAIMSTKGLSNTASRLLVDRLCAEHRIPLLVLHDFDKSGFIIVGTLHRNTRRYEFANHVEVIDLGLRLEDVVAHALQSEDVIYGKSDPTGNLRENGATDEEIAFLCNGRNWQGYYGQRVELNAFASGDLVAWIEAKLQQHGIKKVVPNSHTVAAAYRRAKEIALLNERIQGIAKEVREQAQQAKVPKSLERQIRARLKENPALSWDAVLAEVATSAL